MPSIQLKALSAATPDGRELFSHLDLSFGFGRTGIIGRNGTGKTTLMLLIAGETSPAAGSVQVDGRIGMLRQSVAAGDETVATALGAARELARLARIDAGMPEDGDIEAADWTLPTRIDKALADVGLPQLAPGRPVAALSGGQRTRLALAALLLDAPDFLLLDEPTNNLDADGRKAVAQLLATWRGGAIVVSHDRDLLRGMDRIVELTSVGVNVYGGNWDAYEARKAVELAAAEHDVGVAERRLGELDRDAQRQRERQQKRDAGGKRKAARGDMPKILLGALKDNAEKTGGESARIAERRRGAVLGDLATARAEVEILQPLMVTLESARLPAGRTVLQLDNVRGGPGDVPVIDGVSLTLTGPERVAFTGPNGSGKTTLLRLATGQFAPLSGHVRVTMRHAFLDQQVALLDPALTIRDNYLRLNPDDGENACRAALARFMFRAEAALQPVGTLSGGEILRAGLAATIGSSAPPELLILDEPTNHLDIHAIAAVEAGLRAYDGALLVVSHDRAFLDAIGVTREVELRQK
ncbi:MAG TPA: ABC-F family ATP-binding cassette domain-containing protein [Devosia sp.]|nr:ABC-F family ATP-binding cassette domain-containing protein [Devosia sp.]